MVKKTSSKRSLSSSQVGLKYGFRSGLEEKISKELEKLGVDYGYESQVIKYMKPETAHRYTPDFILSNGIIIESKGRFTSADRKKHLLIKEQHPELDIRFVFSNPNQRISKVSKTTYADWCEKKGFLYSKLSIPMEWINEI